MESPIAFLAGVWRGAGAGEFPTMESFEYEEEVRFLDFGVPALMYQQRAWSPADNELLHIESGIWRASPEGRVAISVALPRVTEISEGTVTEARIELAATSVARAAGGAGLVSVRRVYERDGDEMRYRISMSTEGVTDLTHHLAGTLRRVEASPSPAP